MLARRIALTLLGLLMPCIATAADSIAFLGTATQIVTADKTDWLTEREGAYVRVAVSIDSPYCLTPGQRSWFSTEDVEVALSIMGQGFQGVTKGRKDVPLAAYQFKGEREYCTDANLPRTIIVPAARFGAPDADGMDQPYLQLFLRAQTEGRETIVPRVKTFLTLAGVFATGGAAATVTGIAGIFSDKATKVLDDTYAKFTSNQPRGPRKVIDQPWSELAQAPLKTVVIPLYIGTTKYSESAEDAIRRMEGKDYKGSDRRLLANVTFSFEYMRSLFDPKLPIKAAYPDGKELVSQRVLGYPGGDDNGDFPNLIQRLSGSSPSIVKRLASDDYPSACRDAMNTLDKQLQFNRIDRAIAMKALLDDARGPQWTGDSNFISACLQSYTEEVTAVTRAIYKVPGAVSASAFNIDAPVNADYDDWKRRTDRQFFDLQAALEKAEATDRRRALNAIVGKSAFGIETDAGWNPAKPDETGPTEPVTDVEGVRKTAIEFLASRGAKTVGCFIPSSPADLQDEKALKGAFAMAIARDGKADESDLWLGSVVEFEAASRNLKGIRLGKMSRNWGWRFYNVGYDSRSQCERVLKPMLKKAYSF
jgi:hypothetical protein